VDFDREVRPILADKCFTCHGFDPGKRVVGLRLDTAEGATAVLASGHRAIVPGNAERSELVKRVAAKTMPPPGSRKQLSEKEIDILRRWVAQGAKYAKHWAYVTPTRPTPPKVKDAKWVRNPIDQFVLARLEEEGMKPSPEADRVTLIRRASLDLTGIPPTPAEVDAFVADQSPRAFEKVVDRLLASPRYGERLAWDWLDAARYADTNGYQGDRTRTMWPWRDWVIQSFNRDMPYDQFTVEQLAGDLLPNATIEQRVATGFNRNHMLNGEGGRHAEESRVDYVVDRVDTTSTVWMGLTLGCARCHDHKFDPLAQKEYYQLFAYFNNVPETGSVDRGGNANPILSVPAPDEQAKIDELTGKIAALQAQRQAAADPDKPAIQKQLDEVNNSLNGVRNAIRFTTMVMAELPPADSRKSFVLIKGAWDKRGEQVTPGVPASLTPLPDAAPANRLGLARWLVDPAHPLTGRVTVNRYWQLLFGMGLVKTAEDFGVQGERPTHPELLDWLACWFIASPTTPAPGAETPAGAKWSVKQLVRLIVTSATYRQSSAVTPAALERDPENRLLARGSRFRLPSGALRDQALAISGLLVEKIGGPAVKPYQPPGVWEEATFGKITYQQDHGDKLYRRTLYTFWRRIVGPTNLFDSAARQACTVRQGRTNTPLHALTLLNDVTFVEAARVFAQRVLLNGGATPGARIETAFRMATGRKPSEREQQVLARALLRLQTQYRAAPDTAGKLLAVGESPRDEKLDSVEHAAYTGLCSLILNLDEVLTRE